MSDNGNPNGSQLTNTTANGPDIAGGAKKATGAAVNHQVNKVKTNLARKAANWVRNKLGKESIKSAAKLSLSGPLGLLLLKVFIVLVAIILLIGIIMFIVTMPGMIMDKLKNLAEGIADAWLAWWGQSTTDQVDDEKVYETLDYIEDMGYDLKGYGFLTDYTGSEEQLENYVYRNFNKIWDAVKILDTEDPVTYDEKIGVVRNEDGNIKYAASDFIIAYLSSENYIYTIKNFNLDNVNWGEALVSRIGALFTDNLNNRSGMLVLKHEGSGIGLVDGGVLNENAYDSWERGSIKVDPQAKTLIIKRGWANPKMKFSLDGWTGRYGMPLDFLVAIQTATFMPDLAYDMTQAFDTEVHILLHKANNGEIVGAYKTDAGAYITYDQISMAINGMTDKGWKNLITEIDEWGLNKGEAQSLIDLGIIPPNHGEGCSCAERLRFDPAPGWADIKERDPQNGTPEDITDDVSKYYYYDKEQVWTSPVTYKWVEKKDDAGNFIEIEIQETATDKVESKLTELDENCKTYFKTVVQYADANNYDSFDTYTPYIEKVTNHWFRDVYFVTDGSDDFVDYDYDYEAMMKERWTLYEKYSADSADEGEYNYNPSKVGQEILFVMNEDGTYAFDDKNNNGKKDSDEQYKVFDGTVEDANPSVLYYEKDGSYEEYTGGLATAEDEGIKLYRKSSNGDYVEYTGNVAVSKKAVTIDIAERYKDLNWNILSDGKSYSAYSPKETEFSEWQQVYKAGNEEYDKASESKKIAMDRVFVEVKYGVATQTGEGQRTETNPEIKKMFLNNNYFRYDGSGETAEIITELRYAVYNKRYVEALNDPSHSKDENGLPIGVEKYGPLTEDELDDEYEITYGNEDNKKTGTYKVGDYAGKLEVLTQDALNAFAMLENTHTLDADYIYRDFKELIVELGYFEKEQLTDETPRLLQFPVPSIGSAQYPARSIDKRVNVEGTMLHSKYDIDTNNQYIMMDIAASSLGDVNTEGATTSETTESEANAAGTNLSEGVESRVADGRVSMSSNPIANTTEVGAISTLKKPQQVTLKEFLKATREMCEKINDVGFDYCVLCPPGKSDSEDECTCTQKCKDNYPNTQRCGRVIGDGSCSCKVNHCKHRIHQNPCDLAETFDKAITVSEKTNFCCDRLVKWALQNVGVIDKASGGAKYLADDIEKLGAKRIEKGESLKPGDILCSSGHIEIVGEKKDGAFVQYNGGHEVVVGAKEGGADSSIGLKTEAASWSWAEYALRLPWSQAEDAMYVGYEGNEAVVSPVTGVLVDYGVYDRAKDLKRENIDMKYGPSVTVHLDEEGNVESVETNETQVTENTEVEGNATPKTEEEEYEPVIDEVGYAVIRVLSKDDFEHFESNINSYWSTYEGSTEGLLDSNGVFKEYLKTEDDLENMFNSITSDEADYLAETVYGYKEFAELYSTYGIYIDSEPTDEEEPESDDDKNNTEEVKKLISGYTIFIDGFKCELPDEEFVDTNEDGSVADETTLPDGKDLTIDSFRIAPSDISKENELIQSQYEMAEEYKLASKSATEKLNLEELIKADAYGAMEVDDVIYIKEGTVIGRTYTDKEVVEVLRADKNEKVEDYKISSTKTEEELKSEDYVFEDKLIGNYLRITMRDTQSEAPIEDVEDYMKLDEVLPTPELDYEFFFWSPYEGGAWGTYEDYMASYDEEAGTRDDVGQGPTIIAVDNDCEISGVSWSLAVGIAQWTNNPGLNNIAGLCKYLGEFDPALSVLSDYGDKNAEFFNSNLQAFKDDWYSICSTEYGYSKMVEGQMTYAYEEEWLNSDNSYYKGIAEWAQDRPMALQGFIFSVMNWGNYSYNGGKLLDPVDSSKDDLTLLKDLARNCIGYGKSVGISGRWDSQAQLCQDIMDGKISEEQLQEWIETKNIEGISPGYGEGVQFDGWE